MGIPRGGTWASVGEAGRRCCRGGRESCFWTSRRHRESCFWSGRFASRNFNVASVEDSPGTGQGFRSQGGFIPGATLATLMMLGALHIRRMYEDKQTEEVRRRGIEPEFAADWKATVLQFLPLRLISRTWGSITSVDLPVWMRHYVYKGWARAFYANLDEASLPAEEYKSLRDFFTRTLKEGARPLDPSPACLHSPVDGVVLQCGRISGSETMIEQVKGFSYSVRSLLGAEPSMSSASITRVGRPGGQPSSEIEGHLSEPFLKSATDAPSDHLVTRRPSDLIGKGLFYCVLYLGPGDYHRIHSPTDWDIRHRRHFCGRLYPVNERAVRTIKNLYVINERVVLEGQWSHGLMALAAVGATNVGSIELKIEPELRTNQGKRGLYSVDSRSYGEKGSKLIVKAGEEVAVFNLGSTVVLVFEAPVSSTSTDDDACDEASRGGPESQMGSLEDVSTTGSFKFCTTNGQRIKMGQALGHW